MRPTPSMRIKGPARALPAHSGTRCPLFAIAAGCCSRSRPQVAAALELGTGGGDAPLAWPSDCGRRRCDYGRRCDKDEAKMGPLEGHFGLRPRPHSHLPASRRPSVAAGAPLCTRVPAGRLPRTAYRPRARAPASSPVPTRKAPWAPPAALRVVEREETAGRLLSGLPHARGSAAAGLTAGLTGSLSSVVEWQAS